MFLRKNTVNCEVSGFFCLKRIDCLKSCYHSLPLRTVDCVELFDDMQQCIHQHPIILTLCGMLYAVLIDCPGALIWNKYHGKLCCRVLWFLGAGSFHHFWSKTEFRNVETLCYLAYNLVFTSSFYALSITGTSSYNASSVVRFTTRSFTVSV